MYCTALLSCLAYLSHAQTAPPASPAAETAWPPPPPLPPAQMAPLPSFKLATLESSIKAPPASPPWSHTPAGKREEGRGWLLQQKLRDYIAKAIGILHSGEPLAVRASLSELSLLALESTIISSERSSWLSGIHPIAFRKACISNAARSAKGSGSVVEAVARLIDDPSGETSMLALQALEAIATDDPSTDTDNHHALAICSTRVIPSIVRLLRSSSEAMHTRAASAAAALVENAHCAKMFVGAGAITPLLALASHGSDTCRQHSFRSLRMLALDRDACVRLESNPRAPILRQPLASCRCESQSTREHGRRSSASSASTPYAAPRAAQTTPFTFSNPILAQTRGDRPRRRQGAGRGLGTLRCAWRARCGRGVCRGA